MLTSNGYQLSDAPNRWGSLTESNVGAAAAADRERLWGRLRRDGYLLVRDFLDPQLVLDFREYYFRTLAPAGVTAPGSDPVEGRACTGEPDRATFRSLLFNTIVPGPQYQALCSQPAITGFFGWMLDADIHLHRRKILRHTRPGDRGIGQATQAHYDLVYLREGTDRVLSMWIPLGDCPVERGGLVYLEGSHRRVMARESAGLLPRPAASITADLPALADEYDARWLGTDFRAGDVMIHSAHIVHAATDNVDPNGIMRLSTDIRYQRLGEPIDWRWQRDWHDRDGL
jgi:ectoine hydroxylase-related dioxygenase (phytanoyl-CoA dioxygenase family)